MKIHFRKGTETLLTIVLENHTLLKTRLVMHLKAVTYRRIVAETLIAHLRHLDFFKNKHPNRRNEICLYGYDHYNHINFKGGIPYQLSLTYYQMIMIH